MQKTIAVNEAGFRVGEDHQNAKLTNAEVELMRQLNGEGLDYATLAEKFEISKEAVGRICRFERRTAYAARVKTVCIADDELNF